MKIAVSSTAPDLDAQVDPRFGRCQYFVIADSDTMEFEGVENTNMMAGGGAGIATAQMIANKGAQVVLTGNCGPNAYQTLSAAGIQVITGASGTVRDALEGFRTGKFEATAQPNVDAHFGTGGMGTGGGTGVGRGMGKGTGRGMGRGMSMSAGMGAGMASGQEAEDLRSQIQKLTQQVDSLQERIRKLEKNK
jgi:predicted Fe-Mo cluster-binding NifX family protein